MILLRVSVCVRQRQKEGGREREYYAVALSPLLDKPLPNLLPASCLLAQGMGHGTIGNVPCSAAGPSNV